MGFLRPDHQFLSSALNHPSTTFLLFNKLEPLTKSGSELARCTFADVKPLIGENPFEKSEEEVIAQYNSSLYVPQIIFLGLDERKDGFKYKEHYKGQPWFAVDVTPKESVKEKAEELLERMTSTGLEFSKGRMNLSLQAEEGALPLFHSDTSPRSLSNTPQRPSMRKPDISSIGTNETLSALLAVTRLSLSTPGSSALAHPKTSRPKSTKVNAHPARPEPVFRTCAFLEQTPQSSWRSYLPTAQRSY